MNRDAEGSIQPASFKSPLSIPIFRWIWLATLVSNLGSAMQVVAATWAMMAVDSRPVMIASLQAASTLPMFIAGLPAGVLADIVDRRRLLVFANAWMVLAALALAAMTCLHAATPQSLLALTFALGLGAAVNAPAFQAIVPELAPDALLVPAISLNSAGSNVARSIGPALGGLLVGWLGAGAVFALNALSTVGVVIALIAWRRTPAPRRLPPEHFFSALRSSLRYVSAVPQVKAILYRTALFFIGASALWALLPLLASQQWHWGASGYGSLLGTLGLGALAAALAMPRLRARRSLDLLSLAAALLAALADVALAMTSSSIIALCVIALFGAGWVISLTLLNVCMQTVVEGWMRARMLAIFVVTYMGAMTAGSIAWGYLAQASSPGFALLVAGVMQLLSVAIMRGLPLTTGRNTASLAPVGAHDPPLLLEGSDERAAVLVTIDYQVPLAHLESFRSVLELIRRSRMRNGAISWRHWQAQDGEPVQRESYLVESWIEYLRQQLRRTQEDEALEQQLVTMLAPGTVPVKRMFREAAARRHGQLPAHR